MGGNVHMNIPAVASMGNDLATCSTELTPATSGLLSGGELGARAAGDLAGASTLATAADDAAREVSFLADNLSAVLEIDSEYVILAAAQVKEAFGE